MSDLIKKSLHEVIHDPINGARPKGGASSEGDIPSFGGENITMIGGIEFYPVKKVRNDFFDGMKRGHLRDLDVLINKDGANTGKSAIYRNSPYERACINEHLFILRGLDGHLNQIYLHYLLQSPGVRKTLERKITGSAQPGLNSSFCQNFPIEIVPLPEQKKIASILTSVDEVIENTQKQINKLQDLKKATMNELLTKGIGHAEFKNSELGRIPKSWKTGRFGQFITLQRGHDLPVQDRCKGDIPIYGSNGIVGYHNKTQIEAGGVVTGRSGSIGDVYFEKSNYWALNTTLYVKDFHENDKEFVSCFLKYFQLERFSTGTGVPTLNRNDVHNQVIAFPDFQEQLAICEVMASIISPLGNLEKKLNQTQSLKKSLMQDLLTGKVKVKVN